MSRQQKPITDRQLKAWLAAGAVEALGPEQIPVRRHRAQPVMARVLVLRLGTHACSGT